MSTGHKFIFNDFFPPQPNNNYNDGNNCIKEDCLIIGFSSLSQCLLWDDIQCSALHNFICEIRVI